MESWFQKHRNTNSGGGKSIMGIKVKREALLKYLAKTRRGKGKRKKVLTELTRRGISHWTRKVLGSSKGLSIYMRKGGNNIFGSTGHPRMGLSSKACIYEANPFLQRLFTRQECRIAEDSKGCQTDEVCRRARAAAIRKCVMGPHLRKGWKLYSDESKP